MLRNFIGEKLILYEIEDFEIQLSDQSLSTIIKNEEMFKKDTEVPIIKFGNYDSLSQMATGLKQITNFNEKSATFNLFKNQAIEAQKAGYTREHFVTELGEGITALFFPDVN